MPDMNELLEQATSQAVELAKNAAEASAVLDALTGAGKALEEQISTEMEAVREAVHGLTELLERARADVESARAEAVADLDAATAEAGTTATEVAADFDTVQESLEALAEHETQVQKAVDPRVGTAEADLDRAVEAMEAADASASTHFTAANTAAASFKASREKERAEIETRFDGWKTALAAHTGEAEGQSGSLMLGFEGLEKAQAEDAKELLDAVLKRQETSVATLQAALGDELADALKAVADALSETFEGYARRGDSGCEAAQKSHDAVTGKAAEVTTLADEIRTSVLHSVSVIG